MIDPKNILDRLPYQKPFLFVDQLLSITADGVVGTFTFDASLDFYKGHFKDHPVTPGVILTEVMAQIGVVCLGIYLMDADSEGLAVAMTSTEIEFLKPVFPGETVTVTSKKQYFRFGKLKCSVEMTNGKGEQVCSGVIAGLIIADGK